MLTCILGIISTCFERKTTANGNLQKLSKFLPCRSYSGSYVIEIPTVLSNEITEVTKSPDFLNVFTIDINRFNVRDGHVQYFISTLLTFKIRVRF